MLLLLLIFLGQITTGHHRGNTLVPSPVSLVNQAAFISASPGNPYTYTQSLGFTATAGNSLFCLESSNNGGTTAFASMSVSNGSPTAMTVAATNVISGRVESNFAFLPNLPSGINTVIVQLNSQVGASVSLVCYEIAGLSHSASVSNAAVISNPGFVSTNTWTTGSYTALGGTSLVFSGSSQNYASGGTWTAGSGWTMPNSTPCTSFSACASLQYIIGGSGSIIPTGTYSQGSGGAYYASFIVEIK